MCTFKYPTTEVYGKLLLPKFKVHRKIQEIQIKPKEDCILIILPSVNFEDIVNGLFKYIRKYLSHFSIVKNFRKLQKAIDIYFLRCISRVASDITSKEDGLQVVVEKFIDDEKARDPEVAEFLEFIPDIDVKLRQLSVPLDERLLRILLVETYEAKLNRARVGSCLCDFVKYLQKINNKKANEEVNTTFVCKPFSLSILMIGKTETMSNSRYGYEPYLSYIRALVKYGVKTLYIIARGELNCFIAKNVVEQAVEENILGKPDVYTNYITYREKTVRVLCARLKSIHCGYNPAESYLNYYNYP